MPYAPGVSLPLSVPPVQEQRLGLLAHCLYCNASRRGLCPFFTLAGPGLPHLCLEKLKLDMWRLKRLWPPSRTTCVTKAGPPVVTSVLPSRRSLTSHRQRTYAQWGCSCLLCTSIVNESINRIMGRRRQTAVLCCDLKSCTRTRYHLPIWRNVTTVRFKNRKVYLVLRIYIRTWSTHHTTRSSPNFAVIVVQPKNQSSHELSCCEIGRRCTGFAAFSSGLV